MGLFGRAVSDIFARVILSFIGFFAATATLEKAHTCFDGRLLSWKRLQYGVICAFIGYYCGGRDLGRNHSNRTTIDYLDRHVNIKNSGKF